jgi:hypothetical protein
MLRTYAEARRATSAAVGVRAEDGGEALERQPRDVEPGE